MLLYGHLHFPMVVTLPEAYQSVDHVRYDRERAHEYWNTDLHQRHAGWLRLFSLPIPRISNPGVSITSTSIDGIPDLASFLPADAFWNLAMAINTYLTVFKRYTPKQCKSMEKYYCMVNYGLFGIIALAYLFVYTEDKDKMYGRATLWCWINPKYDSIRLVTCYVPAW